MKPEDIVGELDDLEEIMREIGDIKEETFNEPATSESPSVPVQTDKYAHIPMVRMHSAFIYVGTNWLSIYDVMKEHEPDVAKYMRSDMHYFLQRVGEEIIDGMAEIPKKKVIDYTKEEVMPWDEYKTVTAQLSNRRTIEEQIDYELAFRK